MGEAKIHTTSIVSLIPTTAFCLRPGVLSSLGIMFLTAVLSFLFLGEKSFWLDEAIGIAIVQSEWTTLWHTISQYEAVMSLYYILLHL